MLHPEKPDGPFVHSRTEVMQKIGDNRAYKVKCYTQYKLDMCKGGGCGSYAVVKFQEAAFLQPAPVTPKNGKQKAAQYQPAGKRV